MNSFLKDFYMGNLIISEKDFPDDEDYRNTAHSIAVGNGRFVNRPYNHYICRHPNL